MQRFDSVEIRAKKTEEGFLIDSPVVARTGIQIYFDAQGNERRELRLAGEVFAIDSLASLRGKPITLTHKGVITAKNFKKAAIGTVLSGGYADGDTVRAEIIIQDHDAIAKAESGEYAELSLGYNVELDETAGVWQGQHYDAVQRNIRVNHLSLVRKARAGSIARLNLDGDQDQEEENNMIKIRLDSGIEYDAAPEIGAALDSATARADSLQAQIAELQTKCDGFDELLAQARADGESSAKARATLETMAAGVTCDGLSDQEIKVAYIKSVRGDSLDLSDKSEAYIDAAFDMARADAEQRKTAMRDQRKTAEVKQDCKPEIKHDAASARTRMIESFKGVN